MSSSSGTPARTQRVRTSDGTEPSRPRGKFRRFLNRLLVWSARIIEEDNEAIWSVPRPFKRAYSIALSAICSPLLITIIIEKINTTKPAGWWTDFTTVTGESATEFAPIGIGVAIALLVIAHIGAVIVSLYHMIANRWVKPVVEEHIALGREEGLEEGREQGREEGLEEGREQGRAEVIAEVQAWLRRKDEAEAKGEPFSEPPPGGEP